ncbi:MAG: 50S ribosomal protein L4 [Firmicutes bacterium]|nr:50S ribosomal protein L4 [Bacillota bacterium]
MPTVPMFNMAGEQVGQIELPDALFGQPVHEAAIYAAVVGQMKARRAGSASTKTRAEVRGGGRKPWRQKGTGRARQGSIRAPQWKGGGVVFGPKPRVFENRVPKRVRRLALLSALSSKVRDGEILVVDRLEVNEPKTKQMATILRNLKLDRKVLLVQPQVDRNLYLSSRNLPGVRLSEVRNINVVDVLDCDKLVVTPQSVARMQEVLGE